MEIEKARASVAARHYEMPTPVFEKNQYALTRKTKEGVVEWATSWGGWSPDMRAGFFRDCAHVVAHRMQQENMAGGEVSEVVTRVYDDTEGNRRFFEGVATDDVIVARRGDDARLVTHNGVLGRGNQISAEAGQAVSADGIIVSPGAEWKQAVAASVEPGIIHGRKKGWNPPPYVFSRAIRHVEVRSTVSGGQTPECH